MLKSEFHSTQRLLCCGGCETDFSPFCPAHRELSKICKPHITTEDEGKFRCKECKKLFKAVPFVEKHIGNKHPELIGDKLEEVSCRLEIDPIQVRKLTGHFSSGQILQQLRLRPSTPHTSCERCAAVLEQPKSPSQYNVWWYGEHFRRFQPDVQPFLRWCWLRYDGSLWQFRRL